MRLLAPPPGHAVVGRAEPTFSILVAAHDVAEHIGAALDSVLAQSLPPLEIIVCDDASTDELEAALEPYRHRIRYLRHDENRGEAAAKNTAARAATGEFVAILDADDVFYPERLEALRTLAVERPDLDILTTDAYFVAGGTIIRRCYEPYWPFVTDDQRLGILERNFVFGLAAVRRERLQAIGGFDETIRWTTDWDCWIRLILGGSRAGLVAEPLAEYRVRETSLSGDRVRHLRGRIQTLEKASALAGLSARERETVEAALADQRRALALEETRASLAAGRADARGRALGVARDRAQPPSARAKAMVAAAAPGLVGRLARARRRRAWTAPGDVAIARRHPPADP